MPSISLSRRSALRGLAATGALALVGSHTGTGEAYASASEGGGLLFDANYGQAGMARYEAIYPGGLATGVDYAVVRDPAGYDRTAIVLDSRRGLSHGTAWPRAMAESPRVIRPRAHGNTVDEYWHLVTLFLPTAHKLTTRGQWMTLMSPAYGPPYHGPSPLGILITPDRFGRQMLQLGPEPTNLGPSVELPTDRWVSIVHGFRFAYDGWVELSMAVGNVWRTIPVRGRERCPMDTMRQGVNDAWFHDASRAANGSTIGCYGSRSRVYFAHHRIGTSRASLRI